MRAILVVLALWSSVWAASFEEVKQKDNFRVRIISAIPGESGALAQKMEGASVAQVCREYDVPCVVIRTISDQARGSDVHIDILKFISEVSGHYSMAMIENIYNSL